ncbi:MAG: adenylate/guanylate cyclase domain-containing protein [Methanocellales archaeon]|nr:adenylate/guanylate cyclase domain-containing protein [Methanocellales archaeon]
MPIDKERGLYHLNLELDERYYEKTVRDGEEGYFSKKDDLFIPVKVLRKTIEGIRSVPLYYRPPRISDISEYVEESKERAERLLQVGRELQMDTSASDVFLEKNRDRSLNLVVIYIDLMDSTKLSRTLPSDQFKRYIQIFSSEMTYLIDGYNGYVLKYAGDGVIGFFPTEKNFMGIVDNAVNCALAIKTVIKNALNPILAKNNLPSITFRIGLDFGESGIIALGVEGIKTTMDLLGYTMNMAAKIQSQAKPNQIMLGEAISQNLHSCLKEFCVLQEIPEGWKYTDPISNQPYKFYLLNAKLSSRGQIEGQKLNLVSIRNRQPCDLAV